MFFLIPIAAAGYMYLENRRKEEEEAELQGGLQVADEQGHTKVQDDHGDREPSELDRPGSTQTKLGPLATLQHLVQHKMDSVNKQHGNSFNHHAQAKVERKGTEAMADHFSLPNIAYK